MQMILTLLSKRTEQMKRKKTGVQSIGCVVQHQLLNLRLESFRVEHEFIVNMTNVRAPTSSFTNLQILDKEHATEIYGRLLTRKSVSLLTLRPVYYKKNYIFPDVKPEMLYV